MKCNFEAATSHKNSLESAQTFRAGLWSLHKRSWAQKDQSSWEALQRANQTGVEWFVKQRDLSPNPFSILQSMVCSFVCFSDCVLNGSTVTWSVSSQTGLFGFSRVMSLFFSLSLSFFFFFFLFHSLFFLSFLFLFYFFLFFFPFLWGLLWK